MSKFFITTAIDYVNSLPHIGTAYEKIGADVLARFQRMKGDQVTFQMGNDEHSANVQKAAFEAGIPPKKYCDDMRPRFEKIWQKLHVSYDQFVQTSDPKHHQAVIKFFEAVNKRGDIYQKDYEGWYCESCEAFYTEKDLEEGLCKNHKTKPKWLKEQNYFFKLKKYEEKLLAHIEQNPHFILPAKRRNEVVNFIKQGLEDFSISRSTFTWGIPVPLDPTHVFYVWFDALINYLTLIGYADESPRFNQCWPADLHVVGKDITRFHCVIWPAMLMSAGLPLPKSVFGHGFVYLKGEKMSKSIGNVVTPLDILQKYPEFGADALRYYLLRGSSFGDDGNFTWDGFVERYNADLANGLGNLVSRILGMVWRYQEGKVFFNMQSGGTMGGQGGGGPRPKGPPSGPERSEASTAGGGTEDRTHCPIPDEFMDPCKIRTEIIQLLDPAQSGDIKTHFALEKIWKFIGHLDQMIDKLAPWVLAKKEEKETLSEVLSILVIKIQELCVLLYPFLPQTAGKIWEAYGFGELKLIHTCRFDDLDSSFFTTTRHSLKANKLNLFPRIVAESFC